MQIRTDRNGLAAIFKDWQVPLVLELHNGKPMTSRDAHKFLEEHNIRAGAKGRGTVSRASVINFLNDMVDQDLFTYTEETGKGGHHRIYRMTRTREEFAYKIIGKFVNTLLEVFPEESITFPWPSL